MEDDHVDRPGVEERQRLKLTGTNSSTGLIVLIPYVHQIQRSRMIGPSGLCSARAPENRRRTVALAGFARKAVSVIAHAERPEGARRAGADGSVDLAA